MASLWVFDLLSLSSGMQEEETRYMVAVDGSKQSGQVGYFIFHLLSADSLPNISSSFLSPQAFRWVLREAVRFRDKSKVHVVVFNCLPECDFQVYLLHFHYLPD